MENVVAAMGEVVVVGLVISSLVIALSGGGVVAFRSLKVELSP